MKAEAEDEDFDPLKVDHEPLEHNNFEDEDSGMSEEAAYKSRSQFRGNSTSMYAKSLPMQVPFQSKKMLGKTPPDLGMFINSDFIHFFDHFY